MVRAVVCMMHGYWIFMVALLDFLVIFILLFIIIIFIIIIYFMCSAYISCHNPTLALIPHQYMY